MQKKGTSGWRKILIILLISAVPGVALAQQEFDIAKASLYYPHRFETGKWGMEVAISQVKLPFDWLENSIQAPLFQYHVNLGLPKGFALDSRFSTLFVSNQVSLGPRWNWRKENFSFNVGYDLAFAFGFLNQFGFDTKMNSWSNIPNASVGYRLGDLAFTLRGEVNIVTSLYTEQGENVVASDRNFNNGYTIALYCEQRISRDNVIVLGLKNSLAKYHFMAWPAFSTFNRYYNIPEFYIGLIL